MTSDSTTQSGRTWRFHQQIQETKPNQVRKTDLSTDAEDLLTTDIQVSVFESINKKLDLLAMPYQEMKD